MQAGKYAWVEMYSEEHKRPFYYDQQNHISTWDKPADLAWRRVYFPPETDNHAEGNSKLLLLMLFSFIMPSMTCHGGEYIFEPDKHAEGNSAKIQKYAQQLIAYYVQMHLVKCYGLTPHTKEAKPDESMLLLFTPTPIMTPNGVDMFFLSC